MDQQDLDCVIVGCNNRPLSRILEEAEQTRQFSGAYEHFKANSAWFRAERLTYADLFNRCFTASTGRAANWNVFQAPQLGVHYLANFLLERGFRAEPVNSFNDDRERLEQLLERAPRAVAITTTFYVDPSPVREIVDFLRRRSSDTRIIVGGTYIYSMVYEQPEAMQDVLFRRMGADIYVCDAQGELTLSRICAELRETSPRLERVPNLAFPSVGKSFLRTRRQIEVNDLNQNAMRWERFDSRVVAPTALVRTSRSCPNQCAFCRYPVLEGPHTLADLATVEKELDDLHSIGVTHIVFVDDTFNIPPDRFKDLCRMMIRKKYGFRWLSYFRCANADEEAFDLAAESGAMMLFLGIEAGDQRILDGMNKNATVEQYHRGIQELKKRGIDTYASTMIGFPGETEQTARNTMRFIEEAEPTFYSMEVYFHDTKVPVAARKEEYGISGSGYSWRHDTMDWRDATELLKVGYRSIRGSSILPLYCFNVWSLGYYHSHGVARDRLREFVRLASRLCVAGLDDPPSPNQDAEDRILRVFGKEAGG